MSSTALRRVMIRMLHDPGFAAAVYTDPARALAGVDVTATEIGWVTARPPAAWRTDPERPVRLLAALEEEYPATVSLAADHAAGFFRSPEFHAAVQERGSLALALGAYLMRAPGRAAAALARLEHAIAAVRRAPRRPPPSPAGHLRLTPRAALRTVPEGTLALLERARRRGVDDAIAVADQALGDGDEAALVTVSREGEVAIELLEPALAAILGSAAGGGPRPTLLAAARVQGADPGEDAEIVERLVADRLLV
jgi:hypothetical protein